MPVRPSRYWNGTNRYLDVLRLRVGPLRGNLPQHPSLIGIDQYLKLQHLLDLLPIFPHEIVANRAQWGLRPGDVQPRDGTGPQQLSQMVVNIEEKLLAKRPSLSQIGRVKVPYHLFKRQAVTADEKR